MGKSTVLLQQSLDTLRSFGSRRELADTLHNRGIVAWASGEYTNAQGFFQEGLQIYSDQQAHWGMALCQASLGLVAHSLGEYQQAKQQIQQALVIFKAIGDVRLTGIALGYLSAVNYQRGEHSAAKRFLHEGLRISRSLNDRLNIALCLNRLGAMAYQAGTAELPEASRYFGESLAISTELGNHWEMASSLNHLGYVSYALADYQAAHEHFVAALQTASNDQIAPLALSALVGLATLLIEQPDAAPDPTHPPAKERAAGLLGLVLAHPAAEQEVKDGAQRLLTRLEVEMPPAVLAAATERGRASDLVTLAAEILA